MNLVKILYLLAITFTCMWFVFRKRRPFTPEEYNRLLKIKYLGDSRYIYLKEGSQNLFFIKHLLKKSKSFKSSTEKIKFLFDKNSINLNVYDYIIMKHLIITFFSLFTGILLWIFRSDSIYDTAINNINIVVPFMIFIAVFPKVDIWLLNLLYQRKISTLRSELYIFSLFVQLATDSGNNLYNALRVATDSSTGLLKKEFEMALDEYSSGSPFDISIRNLEKRLELDDLTDFFSFLRRSYASDNFADMVNAQRTQIQKYNFDLAREYDRQTKEKFKLYNNLTASADFIIILVPLTIYVIQSL